jgi:transcriptional regulator with XRE-family HTH domain
MRWTDDAIDQLYIAIGRRVKEARQHAGLTQTELASRLELTRSSVANIEAGRQRVTIHWLIQIAEELDVPVTRLLVTRSEVPGDTVEGRVSAELHGQPSSTQDFVKLALRQAE